MSADRITILNRRNKAVLFSHETTIGLAMRNALEAAATAGANLTGADLSDAGKAAPTILAPVRDHIAVNQELARALRDMLDSDDHDDAKNKARAALAQYAESLTPAANGGAA